MLQICVPTRVLSSTIFVTVGVGSGVDYNVLTILRNYGVSFYQGMMIFSLNRYSNGKLKFIKEASIGIVVRDPRC